MKFNAALAALALAFITFPAFAADVTVTITKVAANGTRVGVQLCTEKEFLSRCALRQGVPGTADTVSVTFTDVPPGTYAMTAYQDMDGDGRMATGPFGIPSEPVAISRDAKGMMGPPAFADAAFTVADQPVKQAMVLN